MKAILTRVMETKSDAGGLSYNNSKSISTFVDHEKYYYSQN